MRKVLKILRKILFWICFVSLFIVTCLTVILKIYEDDIKQYAIDSLNEYLRSEVIVQDIELSIFHDFPSASIAFDKVLVPDAYENKESSDTLFYADELFFNFNIVDVFTGDYNVHRISAHNGKLQLKTTEDGQINYDIIRATENTDKDNQFEFSLELLSLENISFHYQNFAARQFYNIDINSGLLNGNFSADHYDLLAEADLNVVDMKSNSFHLIQNKSAKLNLDLAVNTLDKSYTFNNGDLMIEKMPFHVEGVVDSATVDLKVSGKNIGIADLANSLVDESVEDVKTYEGEGVVDFVSTIKGPIAVTSMPSVEAEFSIVNGSIIEPEQNLKIQKVNFQGHYQNEQDDRQEELALQNVNFELLDSYFKGDVKITDFSQPLIDTKMHGNLDLSRIHDFFHFKDINQLAGNVAFDVAGKMKFFNPQYHKEQFKVIHSKGDLSLKNVAYQAKKDELYYHGISGDIVLNDADAAAHQLAIRTKDSDLLINGALENFIPFLEGSGKLGLIASVESKKINLNEFLKSSERKKDDALSVFELPNNIDLDIDVDINDLKWEHHQFNKISSNLSMHNRTVELKKLALSGYNGKANGHVKFDNRLENGNVISGKVFVDQLNIKKLFADWNNFNQKSITSNNLSGIVSGDLDLKLVFNPYFSLVEEELFAQSNIEIDKGELNKLQAMKEITAYMRSNKGLKLLLNKHIDQFEQKLLNLKFSKLENEITIKNRRINIPKMTIKTNALDVDMFGWHSFDNQIEYHFSFRFRELKSTVEENEFGIIEDDGLGFVVYLTMFGDLDNPEFALDKDERRKNIKEDIEAEKETVKSILKSELGIFKNDTSVTKIDEDSEQKEIEYEMYNEETDSLEQEQENLRNRNKKTKKNKEHSIKLFQKWKKESEKDKDSITYERIETIE